jgi:hypothetical protein
MSGAASGAPLERCDADAMPAYLESTKSGSVPLYEHFGFEVTGTLNPPRGAPPLTAMWRTPACRRREDSLS